jgi:hypothetical protein
MPSKRRALKIQSVTDRRELHHDVVEGTCEIILPSRIGSTGRLIVRSGHGRQCAEVGR